MKYRSYYLDTFKELKEILKGTLADYIVTEEDSRRISEWLAVNEELENDFRFFDIVILVKKLINDRRIDISTYNAILHALKFFCSEPKFTPGNIHAENLRNKNVYLMGYFDDQARSRLKRKLEKAKAVVQSGLNVKTDIIIRSSVSDYHKTWREVSDERLYMRNLALLKYSEVIDERDFDIIS